MIDWALLGTHYMTKFTLKDKFHGMKEFHCPFCLSKSKIGGSNEHSRWPSRNLPVLLWNPAVSEGFEVTSTSGSLFRVLEYPEPEVLWYDFEQIIATGGSFIDWFYFIFKYPEINSSLQSFLLLQNFWQFARSILKKEYSIKIPCSFESNLPKIPKKL